MNFELAEEQVMLKNSAREFLEKECPKKHVRAMMDDERGCSPELWKKMAGLGWQGLAVPEHYGGMGSTFLDLAVLAEEMGRALVPGPFLPTVVHAGRAVLYAGSQQQKNDYLPRIVRGDLIMTLALTESNGSVEPEGINLTAVRDGAHYVINGIKMFIPDAHVAETMVVAARTSIAGTAEDGITLFLIDKHTDGVTVNALKTMTGEKLCQVVFNNARVAEAAVLGEANGGWPVIKQVIEEASVAESAWMAGGARWVLETTVDYVKQRVQFGRPIGSFQAIQHKCADMAVEVEGCTAIVYYAAWAISENDPARAAAISISKAWCGDSFKHVAAQGIQLHGGIGFTWDHDMHLYFKRAMSGDATFGDATYHRELLAKYLDSQTTG